MAFNPQQAAQRYQQAAQNPQTRTRYEQGIDGVTESPMEKAAAAEDLYLRRVEEASRSGKRRAKLLAVSLSDYKAAAKAKSDRLMSGMTTAANKVQRHFNEWADTYRQAHDVVQGMPKGTADAAIQRVGAVIRLMMQKAGRS